MTIRSFDRVAAASILQGIIDGMNDDDVKEMWTPNAGPQADAYGCLADELFYGGGGGGGKSDLIIGLAVKAHRRSVIFRREYPQLRGLMARIEEVIGQRGRLNQGTGVMRMLNGTQVEFGSCPHEKNKLRWQGRPHDLKAFDEICHFTRPIFMFLKSWVRSEHPSQRKRVVCTGNPPTDQEGAWVVDYWAPWLKEEHPNPAAPGELRWFVTTKDGEVDVEVEGAKHVEINGEILVPRSRTFIPALLADNPYLSSDTDYLAVIQALAEPLRSQILTGNFGIEAEDSQWQIVPSDWYDMAVIRWEHSLGKSDVLEAVGVDVARGGGDNTTLAPLYGDGWFGELEEVPGSETPDGDSVVQLVVGMTGTRSPLIGIDVIGVGSSPYDIMNTHTNLNVQGINFGAGTEETDRSGKYRLGNIRAAAYWKFMEDLDPQHSIISLPPDPELRREMLMPRWRVRAGRIFVEGKDDIKERLGKSPDRADALVLAHYAKRKFGGNVAW